MNRYVLSIFSMFLLINPFLEGLPHSNPIGKGQAITPTASLSCDPTRGNVEESSIHSTILNKPLYFRVYTPPCFDDSDKTEKYPILYLFHGSSNTDKQWDQLKVDEASDELIASGDIAPLIIVMPRESAYMDDPRSSRFGDAVVQELIPAVEKKYPTLERRKYRAVGGLSRGAGWALHLGLSHPDQFGSIGTHSLAVFPGDSNLVPKWRVKTDDELLPRLYMDIGLLDSLKDSAKRFEIRLSEYSYPHEWHLNQGTHNDQYWSEHIHDYLLWYSLGWEDRME